MEKQSVPNSTLILVFGILSIVTCCCWGIVGLIFGIVALVLAKQAKEAYLADPEIYTGYSNVRTGRILAIIGIVLSSIYLILQIILIWIYGWDGLQQMTEEMIRDYERSAAY